MRITDAAVQTGFEGYMRIVDFFDKDDTAGSFLNEDGEGGFLSGISRMAREIDRLRATLTDGGTNPVDVAAVRRQAFDEAEHAIGSTVLQHHASDYEGMNSLEAYEAGQINGLECAQSSLVALSTKPAQGGYSAADELRDLHQSILQSETLADFNAIKNTVNFIYNAPTTEMK